ncbi:MAG: NAD(+) diphosphatase [Methylobacteriaceae bacterium]|jgi:NAD+ diphosphatase|nr:NAD(+) diphosphatase [Methylobacteriaceae bacterium]
MLGYISDCLDRRADARDGAAVSAAWQNPDARILLFENGDPVFDFRETPTALFPAAVLRQLEPNGPPPDIFLGVYKTFPVFASGFDTPALAPFKAAGDIRAIPIRKAAIDAFLPPEEYTLVGLARALERWHASTRFCPACATPLDPQNGGYRRDCPACRLQYFPRVDPVVIMLVKRGDACLLGSNRSFETGRYSCLAGFLESGETIEAAVRREVWEESGIDVESVSYFASQPWPNPNQIMIGCFAEAVSNTIQRHDDELVSVRWFSREEAGKLLNRELPGLSGPPSVAIAHHLIRAFIAGK